MGGFLKRVLPVPPAERPSFSNDYGVDTGTSEELLPWSYVEAQMTAARNYWVCSTRTDGRPHAMPVWGVWLDGRIYFGTSRNSVKGRNLAANPEAVVHAESGDDVVIFEGRVVEVTATADLTAMSHAFGQKYPGYEPGSDPDTANIFYTLEPRVVFAWREKDFIHSATCWRFNRKERK